VAAPLLANYPAALPLAFAAPASPPADFSYKLEATATGYVKQTNTVAPGNTPIAWSPTLVPAP
jgi:hypothetical protein